MTFMNKNQNKTIKLNWDYIHPTTKLIFFLDQKLIVTWKNFKQQFKMKRFSYWLPRILSILYILFLGIFALDVFIPGQSLTYYLTAFLIHLTPNFILAVILYIAWKHEIIGAILYVLAFLFLFAMFWDRSFVWIQLILFSPLLITSFLFIFNSIYEKFKI